MLNQPPDHLKDKYNLFALWLDADYGSRPVSDMIIVHIGRPVSLKTICDKFIFDHIELTVEKTNEKIKTNLITGIQKVPNSNIPKYELVLDGTLKEV